jgi:hypothetical protein
MRLSVRTVILVSALPLALACGGDPQRPGVDATATLVSPNGAEGSAVVELTGRGVADVRAAGAGDRVFSSRSGETTRIIVVLETAGEVRFLVRIPDAGDPPMARVVAVAGGDDALRASVDGYRVEF